MTNGYMPRGRGGEDVAPPCGGWFESSFDLMRGLSVIELDEEPPSTCAPPAAEE